MRRERERSSVRPVRFTVAKIYLLPITCHTQLSPSIPLQTTEVVKRPNISAPPCVTPTLPPLAFASRCPLSKPLLWSGRRTPEIITLPSSFSLNVTRGGGKFIYIQTESHVRVFLFGGSSRFTLQRRPVKQKWNEMVNWTAICQTQSCLRVSRKRGGENEKPDKGPNGFLPPFPDSVLTRPFFFFQTPKTPSPKLGKKEKRPSKHQTQLRNGRRQENKICWWM